MCIYSKTLSSFLVEHLLPFNVHATMEEQLFFTFYVPVSTISTSRLTKHFHLYPNLNTKWYTNSEYLWAQWHKYFMWSLILYVVRGIIQNWSLYPQSTYIDVFPWDLGTMILRYSDTRDLNRHGVKGHLGVNDLWFKFWKTGSLYPHTLMYFHGTWTQWSLGRVTCDLNKWGQRSSWGHWPMVHVLEK